MSRANYRRRIKDAIAGPAGSEPTILLIANLQTATIAGAPMQCPILHAVASALLPAMTGILRSTPHLQPSVSYVAKQASETAASDD